jgi:hypothetical protein
MYKMMLKLKMNKQIIKNKLEKKMRRKNPWIIVILAFAVLQFWGCQKHDEHHMVHPSSVEEIEGSDFSKVILTEKAMERIDLQTAEVDEVRFSPPRLVVPYESIIYGPHGETWIYTMPEPRTFIRFTVDIDYIEGDMVVLNEGPPVGTIIATVGVNQVWGTEFEVGH